jgi:hypothetical protein
LAGDYDTTSFYGTAHDDVQGLQMGPSDTDIRVLGEHFHPDHRFEATSPRYPMLILLSVAESELLPYWYFGYVIHE